LQKTKVNSNFLPNCDWNVRLMLRIDGEVKYLLL